MKNCFKDLTGEMVEYLLKTLPQIVFEVTEACNLRCRYCAFSDFYMKNRGRDGKKLSFQTAKKLMDFLFDMWREKSIVEIPLKLNLAFYGGEPLLNMPLIRQIVEYAEANAHRINRRITCSMTTNALLLSQHLNYLVAHDFTIMISLDGDAIGNGYRVDGGGSPTFQTVFTQVKDLQKKYPDFFARNILFNAVLHDRNDYAGIVRFFEYQFGKRPSISPLSQYNLNHDHDTEFNKMLNREQIDDSCIPLNIAPALMTFKKEFEQKSGNYYYDFNELLFDYGGFKITPTGTCLPFSKKLFLSADGRILQCEKIDHGQPLGFVDETTVHLHPESVAARFNEIVSRYRKSCEHCRIASRCPQCIHMTDTPTCKYARSSFTEGIDVSRIRHNAAEALEIIYNMNTKR